MKRNAAFFLCLVCSGILLGAEPVDGGQTKRVLLIGQSPDNHKPTTHEYMPSAALMYTMLSRVDGVQPVVVKADGKWEGGPDLLDSADGVFLFVSEGARWISKEPKRLAAFQRLAKRGGGLCCWHWGMGSRTAQPIDAFVKLFGGCHGGPDRKYKFANLPATIVTPMHPVLRGVEPFRGEEEFYYALKFGKNHQHVIPLMTVEIDGNSHTVSWALERPEGGRSFGFSGGHYHARWQMESYRRLAVHGVLWSIKVPFKKPVNVDADDQMLRLLPRVNSKSAG
ncbi:MAG: ThuA domain-containing protein [Planctomycetaceae bacterium]